MNVTLDLAVLELVCSRLCHDLVGPVGAATNGLELLRDVSGKQNEDILDMTDDSARTAWRRLEFFRVAFGYGGGRSEWSETELEALAAGMLRDTRVTLDWQASGGDTPLIGRSGKLVLNLVFLIAEAMPRGGVVRVNLKYTAKQRRVTITGEGTGATLNDRVLAAVKGMVPLEEMDSRMILAHLACLQAAAADAQVHWDMAQDQVLAKLILPLPAAEGAASIGVAAE